MSAGNIVGQRNDGTVIDVDEGKDGAARITKKRALHVNLRNASGNELNIGTSLVPENYDYISLGYTGSNLTSVIYKTGGAGGTTVATLTLGYSGSVLTSVTRT